MLVKPDLSASRVDGKALRIAVPVTPDARSSACCAHEWIIFRNGTIPSDSDDGSPIVAEILTALALEAIAQRQIQKALCIQSQTSAVIDQLDRVGLSFKNHLLVGQSFFSQI